MCKKSGGFSPIICTNLFNATVIAIASLFLWYHQSYEALLFRFIGSLACTWRKISVV